MKRRVLAFVLSLAMLAAMILPSMVSAADSIGVKMQIHNTTRSVSTQQLNPEFNLVNTGTTALNLQDVKIRYYFTVDGDKPMSFDCWSTVDKSNINAAFIKMASPTANADYYLEISFKSTAGLLGAGQSATIVSWFNKSDWSSFTQTNDYSYCSTATSNVDWDKVTVYVAGALKWGVEPLQQALLAYPLNLKGVSTENSINLTWDAVATATAYDLEVDGVVVSNITTASYLHGGLVQDTEHKYRVRAKNSTLTSDWSPIYAARTLQSVILPAPPNLSTVASETSILVTWSAVPNAISYDIEVDGTVISDLTSTSYNHTGLVSGTQHTYRVRAKNATLSSAWSQPVYARTTSPTPNIGTPANLRGTATTNSILVSWDAVTNAAAYDIEVDGTLISNVSGTSYSHTGLIADTAHNYRVRAKNIAVVGGFSPLFTIRTLPSVVTGPSEIKVKIGSNVADATQMLCPNIEIYNIGDTAVNLKDVKARYYFTIDGEKPLSIDFWTTITKADVVAKFYKMNIPAENADYYLEISFADGAGTLNPGSKVGVYTWANKNDWSNFTQTNDYSYNASYSTVDCTKAPGYVSGVLDWGVEPVPFDIPAFPLNISAVPADNSVSLTWDAVPGATGYDVSADGTIAENITATDYTHNYLSPGTLHTYKVRTKKNSQASIWSNPITVKTTGQQVLPAPSNVKAVPAQNSITISWDAMNAAITGYDVEVDNVITNVDMNTTYTHGGLAQGSQHTYRVRAKDGATMGAWSALMKVNTLNEIAGAFNVNFNIDTAAERAPISPYIYGTNENMTGTENFTARRLGGNRTSTYNWENNASNCGKEYSAWDFSNDGFIPFYYGEIPYYQNSQYSIPGIGYTAFHEKSLKTGAYSLLTLQTAGYAAKDMNGVVSEAEIAPSSRWVEVKAKKNAPFSLEPDLTDNYVYMDEFVNFLVNKFGNASTQRGVKGYEIDNEPGLWADTHPRMHPEAVKSAEVLNKSIELSKAVKDVDPYAEIFGPVLYGFNDYYNMQVSPDWNDVKANYEWYVDYYLDKMRMASAADGRRLLDVFDIHWYPEAMGGEARIVRSDINYNIECNKARIQAPRSLWDRSFRETSWIGKDFSQFLPLIPKIQQSINTYYPGTKLAITEYNYGGEGHVSGGIATADVLGIFGKYGLYVANYWKMVRTVEEAPYSSAAFKIYNNYDGQNSKYGDTKVKAETSDIENSSIYSSVFKDSDNNLHIIAMNKNYDYPMNATFTIAGNASYSSGRVWAFDSSSSNITERTGISGITNNTFTYTIPKLTVCHIVLTSTGTTAAKTNKLPTNTSVANVINTSAVLKEEEM